MKLKQVEAWFGDRGLPLKDFGPVAHYQTINNKWIFISNKYQCWFDDKHDVPEVELYYLKSFCAELYDSWEEEGFNWSESNLRSLLPKEDDDDQSK